MTSSNILVVYSYGSESSLLALIYNVEFCKPSLNAADNTDVSLTVLPFVCRFLRVEDGTPSSDVVDRFRMSAASEAVDISLIVRSRRDLISLSGVRLPSPSFDSPKSSKRSCDKAFSRSRDGVRDRSDFFSVALLGVSSRSKSLFDPVGDKESRNKLQRNNLTPPCLCHKICEPQGMENSRQTTN